MAFVYLLVHQVDQDRGCPFRRSQLPAHTQGDLVGFAETDAFDLDELIGVGAQNLDRVGPEVRHDLAGPAQ